MAAVTFLNPGLRDKIVLDISPEEGRTLSSVMSQYQLREVCCGKGQCGNIVEKCPEHVLFNCSESNPSKSKGLHHF